MDTQHIDLLALIGRDTALKRQGATNGGEYAGPCPFCGGRDRFLVWPNADKPRYWCRGCRCTGDAIDYIRARDHVDFRTAAHLLQLDSQVRPSRPAQSRPIRPPDAPKDLDRKPAALTDAEWQTAAQAFTISSVKALQSRQGRDAYAYLTARGLSPSVIADAGLGYNPSSQYQQWGKLRVWLSAGIVIPWHIRDRIWRVKIRSLDANTSQRYTQAAGGANGLYGVDSIPYKGVVLLTEGEFDGLVARTQLQAAVPNFAAVATGSMANARVVDWVVHVGLASTVLLAFDADDAGEEAAGWWAKQLGSKAVRLRPTQHDISDMVLAGEDLAAWVSHVCATA